MRKHKKLSKGILNSVVTTTVAVTPFAVGAITAVTFAQTSLIVANANEVGTSVNENQSGIDAISDNNGQYTVTSEHTNFKWTDIQENPIIVLKMTDGSYKYKKFSGSVTVDIAKAAKDEFVDAETYKTENGPLQADDKVYIIQESDFTSAPTSIEESYDLTKFYHRQNLVLGGDNFFEGATIEDAAYDSVLIALARPGSFVSEIEFKNMSNPGEPSIYLPEENNTLLVVDNIREAVEQAGPNDQSYTNFGLFLSHIAVSDDKVNKPNTVMKLPKGVEVIFADSSGQQTTFAGAMNEIMNTLRYNTDDLTVLNPQQKLKFKFIVKKDEQIIQEDKNWREITLHVYNTLDAVKNLVKTTLENTQNNFTKGIVDNIDFSGLPEVMKNEAVEMEKKYPNVDGSTPQDGALPQFSNPGNKQYNWIDKDGQSSNGNHATSPARYFPYDMDLFQGEGKRITETLRGYIPYIQDYKSPGYVENDIIKIEPSEHDKELIDYYSLGPIFTRTMFDRNFTPEPGGVNESYWNSLVQDIPIPQLDFEPKVNLDIVTLSINTPPSQTKGNVKIVYKALNADGTDVDSSVVLRADVTDTEDAAVGTPWNAAEQEKDEKPETLTHEATNTVYHLVKTAVVVPGVDGESTQTEGTVVAGETVVTYYYAPEQTETIPTDNTAKVTVNYYILDTSTPLQASYEDTPATKISETLTTNTYYLNANGERVPVGTPTVVTNPVDPVVTYDTTLTKVDGASERPTTLKSGGKTYHLVETATTFTDGTGISGHLTKDTVVNYYYAEIKEEVTTVPTNGSVTIKYETVDGEELQTPFPDTPSTEISSITTKRNYYEYNGVKTYVGEAEVTPSTTDVPYDTTEGDEKPDTLQKDGKTYQRVAVKAGSAAENGKVTGELVVTYVYAEVPENPTDPTDPTDGGTTPPTDGGTTPPTDGGTTPPTDGGTTPPTDGGTTPPTDGGTTPPTDGGNTPPTDGETTPPTDGGNTPPTDGETTPPTDGGTTPPTDEGNTPSGGGGSLTPRRNNGNPPSPNRGLAPKTGDVTSNTSCMASFMLLLGSALAFFGIGKKKDDKEDE
ncbi:MAG: hypothetical protein SOR59_03860 [Lachnospiraceae bacterium]|nr:hypothetical protein [Lachnospiraceae bacterium]